MDGGGKLSGVTVAVTRPAHQAGGLARRIEALGAKAVLFPTLAIRPLNDDDACERIDRLEQYALAIFVSANAVEHGAAAVRRRRGAWPEAVPIAAVGSGTASALLRAGLSAAVSPSEGEGAEGLLREPALSSPALAGRKVAIFRGVGGRRTLGDTLIERGAAVDYVEVYERAKPSRDPASFLALGRSGAIDVIIVTSGEGLRNLVELAGSDARPWLRSTDLLVVSERIAQLAAALGFARPPVVASSASEEALAEALLRWSRG